MSRKTFLPGATLGILGGGQLGRMIAVEARRMGYRTVCLDPTPDCPAAQVCDEAITAPFDAKAARALAAESDVVTLEWENVPAALVEAAAARAPVFPSSSVLSTIQDRLVQREFLKKRRLPQTAFAEVSSHAELFLAAEKLGYPCLLKRRRHGYDGKGQLKLRSPRDLETAGPMLEAPCVLEAWVPFSKEVSVILARGQSGETSAFPLAENVHRGGILHTTRAPAAVPARLARRAQRLAADIARALGHVGVMAVEMFVLRNGRGLLVNEIAPRVHNSGHFTLGACKTSQFEQHVRAVCGLPLGDARLLSPVVMVNLLGELWANGEPRFFEALGADMKLHLYGKAKPAPGRKMGHALILGDPAKGLRRADALLRRLRA